MCGCDKMPGYLGCFIYILYFTVYCNAVNIRLMDCDCGISTNWNNRIVGGFESKPNEFPWLVAITDKGRLHCGGTIINDLYILTAGHCIQWNNRTDMVVMTGVHDIRTGKLEGTSYLIAEMILNPRFLSHKLYDENDIALLRLERPIRFSDVARPICLPKPSSSNYYGRMGIVSGWGRLESGGRAATNLRQAFVKLLTPEQCLTTKMAPYVKSSIYCAYSHHTDSCQGDSGGPLILETESGKMTQIGLVSWGMGCGSDTPGIYTKLTHYLNWIYHSTEDAKYCRNE